MNTDPKVSRPRLVAVNRRQMVMRAMDVERLIEFVARTAAFAVRVFSLALMLQTAVV
jgi:hypothetical protein